MAKKVNDKKDAAKADVPKSVIDSLIAQANNYADDMATPRADLADLYKNRIEKAHGLHRGGFKSALSVDNMSPEKRADYLRTFDMVRAARGWDADAPDMFDSKASEEQAPASKPKDKPVEDPVAKNTAALNAGIKPLETAH